MGYHSVRPRVQGFSGVGIVPCSPCSCDWARDRKREVKKFKKKKRLKNAGRRRGVFLMKLTINSKLNPNQEDAGKTPESLSSHPTKDDGRADAGTQVIWPVISTPNRNALTPKKFALTEPNRACHVCVCVLRMCVCLKRYFRKQKNYARTPSSST